jgi:hypothetical protein
VDDLVHLCAQTGILVGEALPKKFLVESVRPISVGIIQARCQGT